MTTESYFSSAKGYRIQKTVRNSISLEGVGLHTGIHNKLRIHPAEENHGIVFELRHRQSAVRLLAHYQSVVGTELATSLGKASSSSLQVSTVEHLLAALYTMGITNALIEVQGREIPILDGSAHPFVEAILDSGIAVQPYSTPVLKVLKPIKIYEGGAVCEFLPRERLRLTTSVEFPHPVIGLQTFALELTPRAFCDELAKARTFGFLDDLDKLRKKKLAQGASLENVLAFSNEGILNPGGLRFQDECVRHKLLDALGDLALCGCWIEAEMVSYRGGHSIHLAMLRALKNYPTYWKLLPAEPLGEYATGTSRIALRA